MEDRHVLLFLVCVCIFCFFSCIFLDGQCQASSFQKMFQQLRQKARESTTTPNTLPVRPIATSPASPDVGEVVLGFDIADWATFVFVGGISFPIGYAIGKPIRTPAMFTMGFLGSVAGFLLAYQNSSGELKQIIIWEDVRKKKVIEIKRSVIVPLYVSSPRSLLL